MVHVHSSYCATGSVISSRSLSVRITNLSYQVLYESLGKSHCRLPSSSCAVAFLSLSTRSWQQLMSSFVSLLPSHHNDQSGDCCSDPVLSAGCLHSPALPAWDSYSGPVLSAGFLHNTADTVWDCGGRPVQ